jgi:eukaryotic-like serine/threonine-protein kinase
MSLVPRARLGPYEVVARLGAGGMGEVWRARDTRLQRDVAVKVLPAELSSDQSRLKRFEKEARSASALNHPNIVTIYDIGSSDSVSYIAMEFVDGKTLREVLFTGPLPIKRVLPIAVQIAEGLARAHEAGIVHRDLKPENVMVTKDGLVKILDFGLAKLSRTGSDSGEGTNLPTETGTDAGTVLGTVGYMSPEQASGQPVDYRSDQFSLGSILYEMATGKRAFQKKTGAQTLAAIIQEEPESLERVAPEIPGPFRWIAEQCLSKDPRDRYASTEDLARDLQRFLGHFSDDLKMARRTPRTRSSLLGWGFAALLFLTAITLWLTGTFRTDPRSAPSFRRLTFQHGTLGIARFAPDDQTIVYSATWSGGTGRDLYLLRIGSPESRLLFPNMDLFSVSDAGELAVMPRGRRPPLLARVSLTGGVPREVIENVAGGNADWAPGGKEIAVVRSVGGRNRLEFPIGRVIYQTDAVIRAPRFSSDGRRIAFIEDNSVLAIDADGQNMKVLSPGSAGWRGLEGPCWTRGEEVLFAASRGAGAREAAPGAWGLWTVSSSGKERLVAQVPGDFLELYDCLPDGRALIGNHVTTDALIGRAPGESEERDLSWLDAPRGVDLSADGRNILFSEVGEGGGPDSGIYLRPTSGAPAKRLGDGIARALSPDGRWVIASRSGRAWLLPTGPGEPKALTETAFEELGGADWYPDGNRIVFSAREKGKGERLYLQAVNGGPSRPISAEGVTVGIFGGSVSPDGRFVVGLPVSEQRGTLMFPEQRGAAKLYPLDGGAPRSIPGLREGELPVQWHSDGRSIFVYRRHEAPPAKIWLLDTATGRRRLWREIRPDRSFENVGRLLVTPDGISYAYGAQRIQSALYLIEGLN